MIYERELVFFEKLLDNFHLAHTIVTPETQEIPECSRGVYRLVEWKPEYMRRLWEKRKVYEDHVIYRISSVFMYRYLLFRLPDREEEAFMLIGPYMLTAVSKEMLFRIVEKTALPEKYFQRLQKCFAGIPKVSEESVLLSMMNVFGETIWGSMDRFRLEDMNNEYIPEFDPLEKSPLNREVDEVPQVMKILEERYLEENRIIQAVAKGQTHKAEAYMNGVSLQWLEPRAADPIRNMKNYLIVFNTLLRKAVETADVHPIHIDGLSSGFAHKIETVTGENGAAALRKEMVRKYCLLVKNHSMKGYSLLVRKVLTQIDSDLTADLSLRALAAQLQVNASYLSALFKKETGKTLTEYVNGKRIEQAIFLLNSTNLQIQTVAQYCGLPDVNYFTKLFKKMVGKTPREYRESIHLQQP